MKSIILFKLFFVLSCVLSVVFSFKTTINPTIDRKEQVFADPKSPVTPLTPVTPVTDNKNVLAPAQSKSILTNSTGTNNITNNNGNNTTNATCGNYSQEFNQVDVYQANFACSDLQIWDKYTGKCVDKSCNITDYVNINYTYINKVMLPINATSPEIVNQLSKYTKRK